jgi:hypothetical protein
MSANRNYIFILNCANFIGLKKFSSGDPIPLNYSAFITSFLSFFPTAGGGAGVLLLRDRKNSRCWGG